MDLSNAQNALASIQHLSYAFIFVLFLIEGPVLNYVVAFAASLGFFNIFIVFLLGVAGNVVADLIYYYIGKIGKKNLIDKYLKNINSQKIDKIKNLLKEHPRKTLLLTKITPISTPGLILAGAVEMPIGLFILYSFLISSMLVFIMMSLGFFSGAAFVTIFGYFKYGIYYAIISVLIIIILLWVITKKVSEKIERI